MTAVVRPAALSDASRILDLLLDGHALEWPQISLNVDKGRAVIAHVITDGICMVAEDGDDIVGSFGLQLCDWWYSDEMFWALPWLYVRPDRRRGIIGIKFLRAIRRFGLRSPVFVIPTLWTRTDAARKSVLFSRYFEPLGGAYIVRRE